MSDPTERAKHSRRRYSSETHVAKQVKIAKQHGYTHDDEVIREPHRLSKHHVMDCGNPGCAMCGNPRHTHKNGLTTQERRFYQDTEAVRDTRSNGLLPPEMDDK